MCLEVIFMDGNRKIYHNVKEVYIDNELKCTLYLNYNDEHEQFIINILKMHLLKE